MTQTQTHTAEAGDVTTSDYVLVPREATPEQYGAGGVAQFKNDMACTPVREAVGNVYRAMVARGALAASPAPRAPAAVPEEVRQAFAFATDEPLFVHDFADPRVSSDPGPQDVCLSFSHPDHITAASMGNGIEGTILAAKRNAIAMAAAWNFARTLATAPAAPPADGGTDGLRAKSRDALPDLSVAIQVFKDGQTRCHLAFAPEVSFEAGQLAASRANKALALEIAESDNCPASKGNKKLPLKTFVPLVFCDRRDCAQISECRWPDNCRGKKKLKGGR